MPNYRTLNVDDPTWESLQHLKLTKRFPSVNAVIRHLLESKTE